MHIDLCIELDEEEISPEKLAEHVREFETMVGGRRVIKMMEFEVTPMDPASRFSSTYLELGEPTAEDVST